MIKFRGEQGTSGALGSPALGWMKGAFIVGMWDEL